MASVDEKSDEVPIDMNLVLEKMQQLTQLFSGCELNDEEKEDPPIFKTFDLPTAAAYMAKCSNIIVMSGAGISTSAGIPDFRTPGTGLYSQLEKYNLPYPEAIFDLEFFRTNPKPFFHISKELYPNNFKPTPTHYFIRLLHEKGKLLRTFTQNIDSLERIAGIPSDKIVEAHGTFFTAHCLECRKEYTLEHVKDIIFKDEIPYCDTCKGLIKPDIVFFNESLPSYFHERVTMDFKNCDFLIIIGTSLAVAPFNNLISHVDKNCPRLLINMEPVGNIASFWMPFSSVLLFDSPKNRRDIFYKSSCDNAVTDLAKLLGWQKDFAKLLPHHRDTPESSATVSKPISTTPQRSIASKVVTKTIKRSVSPRKKVVVPSTKKSQGKNGKK